MKNTEEQFMQDDEEVPNQTCSSHNTEPLMCLKDTTISFQMKSVFHRTRLFGLCLNSSCNTMITHKFKKRLINTVVEHQ